MPMLLRILQQTFCPKMALATNPRESWGQSWGDAHGETMVDGLRFVLLPSNKGKHRLKMECPRCGKLYGPAKWRQHIPACKGR